MTRVIGITGGIATGKSNVSRVIKESLHLPIIDADQITHDIQFNNVKCQRKIISYFGLKILDDTKNIDRQKLGKIVFSDRFQLNQLVRIMDPFIRQQVISEIKQLSSRHELIILDAPTLFENGYQYLTDQIIVVKCNYIYQMKRLIKRNHLSIADASARINSQWPLDIKEQLSDFMIDTSGTFKQTKNQVIQLFSNYF
ncbi:dephospho-CoA kinase [Philodulcilactobacillus myokoensis]|uniref:Dephospho-CoA kinase n=1 Tax=Philodulcilactobacillus myokoensis TaxID=2929573 RepID=A0A9W6ESV5_9LACO|nr:dephospho-CoA kinase [Philodulcilactobacillus myokoensis]GLB46748.1 dephospho-CoA kinase [Philodulcilactobacillus myokoensis]